MKVAIVTGIGGGIGRATAIALAKNGFKVIGMGRRSAPEDPIFSELGIVYVQGDVARAADRERLVLSAEKEGEVTALVNVAGIAPRIRRDLLSMTEESYDEVMSINTKGTLFLTQAVANLMLSQKTKGSIVNISSCSAYTSSVSRGEYCISKAGVSMITRLFADRLAGDGIAVNEICPGIIETPMTEGVKDKYDKLIEGGLIPLGRWGTPEDVARAVLSLCDGTLSYMTGASLILDGGMHIRSL